MNEKVLTMKAVKEQFCIADKRESLEQMREQLTSLWDIERAAELTAKIGAAMNEAEAADGITMNRGEQLIWAVKEAFILGSLDMAVKMMLVNDMGYETLAGEGAEA